MKYQLSVDRSIPQGGTVPVWAKLYEIIDTHNNVDYSVAPVPFIEENHTVTLIGPHWGVNRHESEDVKELSREYPESVFTLTQVSDVLNSTHFDDLRNYTKTDYQDGRVLRVHKPKPIEWTVTAEYQSIW